MGDNRVFTAIFFLTLKHSSSLREYTYKHFPQILPLQVPLELSTAPANFPPRQKYEMEGSKCTILKFAQKHIFRSGFWPDFRKSSLKYILTSFKLIFYNQSVKILYIISNLKCQSFSRKKNIRHFFFFLRNDNYHQNIANNNSPTFFSFISLLQASGITLNMLALDL